MIYPWQRQWCGGWQGEVEGTLKIGPASRNRVNRLHTTNRSGGFGDIRMSFKKLVGLFAGEPGRGAVGFAPMRFSVANLFRLEVDMHH